MTWSFQVSAIAAKVGGSWRVLTGINFLFEEAGYRENYNLS
jgi:hypothetical protein